MTIDDDTKLQTTSLAIQPRTSEQTKEARRRRAAEYGRVLHNKLAEHGLTQADLTRLTKLGKDSISNYILGKQLPSPASMHKIATALHCSVQDFGVNFSDVVLEPATQDVPEFALETVRDRPGFMHLQVNQVLPRKVCMEIMALLEPHETEEME